MKKKSLFVLVLLTLFFDVLQAEIQSTDKEALQLLNGNPHLKSSAGAVIDRRKDGTSIIVGVGMAVKGDDASKTHAEAERNARFKIIELMRGANASSEQRLKSEASTSVRGGVESSTFSEKFDEKTSLRIAGSLRNASSVGSWYSDDGRTYFVALVQRNDVVFIPDQTGIRVDLGKGVSGTDFILPELKGTRGELPNGDRRKREMLEAAALEVRDSILVTLSKQRRYVLTEERDRASLLAEVSMDSYKVKVEGAAGKRSVQVSLAGVVKLRNANLDQDVFKAAFNGGSQKVPFGKANEFDGALETAREQLSLSVGNSLRMAKAKLLYKIGALTVTFSAGDTFVFTGDCDPDFLKDGDTVSFSPTVSADGAKLGTCRVTKLGDSSTYRADGFKGEVGKSYVTELEKLSN
jgi:hypothetical protein